MSGSLLLDTRGSAWEGSDMGYDTATTTETQLWVDNNEPLQRRKMFMWAYLARKLRRGVFNPKLAEKLFRYLCDDAARSYRKEIGEPLPMDDRRQAEKDLVAEFLSRVKDAERAPGDLPADVLAELRKPSTAKPGADPHYQIELANKIAGGRAVGNSYIVTRRPDRLTCELARFDTREEAEAWIAERTPR